jgi:hypothetical protein
MEQWRYRSTDSKSFYISRCVQQLYPQEGPLRDLLDGGGGFDGPRLDAAEKTLFLLWGIEVKFFSRPDCGLVTILTELSRVYVHFHSMF